MDELELLAELIDKYGKSLIMVLYIDDKMSVEQIKEALTEKERRTKLVNEASILNVYNTRGKGRNDNA